MLKDKVAEMKKQGQARAILTEAGHLLETLPQEAVDKIGGSGWSEEKDRSFLDQARVSILKLLIELSRENQFNKGV